MAECGHMTQPPEPDHCVCKRGPDGEPTGWFTLPVDIDHHWFGKVWPCACRLAKQRHQWPEYCAKHSGLSGRLREMQFRSFDANKQPAAYEAARQFALALSPQHFLVLVGPPGTGKTHLSAAITSYMVGNSINAHYVFAPEWLEQLRAGYDDPDKPYQERASWYRKVRVLALDDVRESKTAWVDEQVHLLVDYRLREGLKTVLTTNLSVSEMEDRIRSRLSDRAYVQAVVMESEDYRPTPIVERYKQQEGDPF